MQSQYAKHPECPKYPKGPPCKCPVPSAFDTRDQNVDWFNRINDTNRMSVGEGVPSTDTPGFLPLRFGRPM